MNNNQIHPVMKALESVQREEAKRNLFDFCRRMDRRYPDAPHTRLMTHKLEQVARYIETGGREGMGRLMLFMPPRYWKSKTASQNFTSWLFGKKQGWDKKIWDGTPLSVLLMSYGADLAKKQSKGVRDLVLSKKYEGVFGKLSSLENPLELDESSKAAEAWNFKNNVGGMNSAGVGGAFTGFGAHLFIIDDPFKNREDASSKAQRDRVYEMYQSAVYTRLETGGAIIIVMTRWDQEDVAGKLLSLMVSDSEADQWEVLSLRAEALEEDKYPRNQQEFEDNLLRGIYYPLEGDPLGRKAGEALWEEKHTAEMLRKIRANIGDYEFEAQFNQSPRLAIGEFLDDDDFKIIDTAPDGLQWYFPCDLALGESETSDFNVTGGIAMKGDDIYIRDVIKVRDFDKFMEDYRAVILSDAERHAIFGIESVAFQKLVLKQLLSDPALANREIVEIQLAGRGDKVERARPWRRRAKDGHLYLVRGRWNKEFIRIVTAFPRSKSHDDEVDFVSNGFQMIAEEGTGNQKTASAAAIVVSAQQLFSDQLSVFSN